MPGERFHADEILAGGLRIELFPDLRRPTGAGSEIIHPKRHDLLAAGCREAVVTEDDPHFGQLCHRDLGDHDRHQGPDTFAKQYG